MDTIEFEITWTPLETATLVVLRDNSEPVIPTRLPEVSGTGAVTVAYSATVSPAHTITWTLEFPGTTLKELKAYATLNGGPRRTLDTSDSEDNRWPDQGVVW